MNLLSSMRRRGGKLIAGFFLLTFLLVLIRFPYGELKNWIITAAGNSIGVHVVMSDSDILFPFGLEMRDVTFSSENPKAFFMTPRLEKLVFRASPFLLFSDEKKVRFELLNGGKGRGEVSISDEGIKINIETEEIKVDGLMVDNRLAIDRGTISLSGRMELFRVLSRGDAKLALTVTGVSLRGVNPFLPEIVVSRLNAEAEKKGPQLLIKSLKANLQGIKVDGNGKIDLEQNMKKSQIDLKADVDLRGAEEGLLKDYLPFLTGMAGQKDRFNLLLSGLLGSPDVSIDEKIMR